MMVGRDISQVYHRSERKHKGVLLETRNLSDKVGRVKNISIKVEKGEIVSLAGLVGAGRTELAKLIFGIDHIASGQLFINGEELKGQNSPLRMVKKKVGLVCEDRKRLGLALKDSIAWNIMGVSLKKFFPRLVIKHKKMYEICGEYKKQLRIASPDVFKACRFLSGGNQQKVVLAKWLSCEPDILIFDEPTRGIDVGAKMEIYALMDKLANEGKAILMISSELPEVIGMSDHIYVMKDGKIVNECFRGSSNFNAETIGAMMLGVGGEANDK